MASDKGVAVKALQLLKQKQKKDVSWMEEYRKGIDVQWGYVQ